MKAAYYIIGSSVETKQGQPGVSLGSTCTALPGPPGRLAVHALEDDVVYEGMMQDIEAESDANTTANAAADGSALPVAASQDPATPADEVGRCRLTPG